MKLTNILFTTIAAVFGACGNPGSSDDHHNNQETDSTSNIQVLYDQVMDIHDEVMPKTEDIYELKKKLQDEIVASPNMVIEKRKNLEKRIARLDSVSQLMMKWMHEFEPLPDSVDLETARGYLELEMEKIRKVKAAMLEIIQQEKGVN